MACRRSAVRSRLAPPLNCLPVSLSGHPTGVIVEMSNTASTGTANTSLIARYRTVRGDSETLCAPLATEDYVLQSIPEVSPPKWHLAHTSWFFETFLLQPYVEGYRPFDAAYAYLFNSYYDSVGAQFPRTQRGLLSRPTVVEVMRYRSYVDSAIERLLMQPPVAAGDELARRLVMGLHHEQQHQELLLTDIKYNFGRHPQHPSYRRDLPCSTSTAAVVALQWHAFAGGIYEIGARSDGSTFAFDNEYPRHAVLLQPFRLASRLVTNRDYLAFVEAGGYQQPEFWMSDGWATCRQQQWRHPLYWRAPESSSDEWQQFTLSGIRPLRLEEPVSHVSYYEADAYARWAGLRLPTEQEWEVAAHHTLSSDRPLRGNLRASGWLQPQPAQPTDQLQQLIGDVWEWTASPYSAYPGYQRAAGAFGEYNGKFMSNQLVLRGGSCFTPPDHIRIGYRNFFYPHDRWQMSGIRLAADQMS